MPSACFPLPQHAQHMLSLPHSLAADARVCLDPSLPAGYGVWVSLGSRPQGIFLVSSEREDAEGWVDAVKLLLHIQWSGRQAVLRQALGGASAAAAAAVRRASTELSGRLASVELR